MAILQSKTPCIPSPLKSRNRGYGIKTKIVNGKLKYYLHHRYAWEQVNGPIPKGLIVRHLCHNPECINVEHLALGTQADNRQDDLDAGRMTWSPKGEACGKSKLTEAQAQEILDNKPNKITSASLRPFADKYNLHPDTIRCIWNRTTWKHLKE